MQFPLEIIEKILSNCDCKTLKVAKKVHPIWKQIIDSLIWKKCLLHIGNEEFQQYSQKWISHCKEELLWEDIYDNWLNWRCIRRNIHFQNDVFIYKLQYVSCLTAFGEYIAIGLDNGTVMVYNEIGNYIKSYEHLSDREPRSIRFVSDASDSVTISTIQPPSELLIEYEWATFIHDFRDTLDYGIFHHQRIFTAYNRCICGIISNGCLTIARIIDDEVNRKKSYLVLTTVQIDIPITNNTFVSLSTDKCLVLIDSTLLIVYYSENCLKDILTTVEVAGTLNFTMEFVPVLWRDAWIFHNKAIMSITQPRADTGQILEVFILTDGEDIIQCTKKFYLTEIFESVITGVYLYGNTLVVGFANGTVLFYEIINWKNFDIAKYSERMTMHTKLARILSVDAVESFERRIFYVASPTSVRRITGNTNCTS